MVTTYYRDRKFIGKKGYQAKGPNDAILQIMRLLVEDGPRMIFIPSGSYVRGGLKKIDPDIVHSPLGKTFIITGVTSHRERFNFSFTGYEQVCAAPSQDTLHLKPEMVPRTLNVVRGAEIALKAFDALLTENAWNLLHAGGALTNSLPHYESMKPYRINLESKRVVPLTWANPRVLGFVNLLKQKDRLSIQKKVLKDLIDELPKQLKDRFLKSELPEHVARFAPNNVTRGNKSFVDCGSRVTYKDTYCSIITLSNYSSTDYATLRTQFEELDADELITKHKAVVSRLNTVQFISRAMECAMWANGDKTIEWKDITKKGAKYSIEEATLGSDVLLRSRWIESVPRS